MTWQVILTHTATRDPRRMDKAIAERVIRALERLAPTGQEDVIRLKVEVPNGASE